MNDNSAGIRGNVLVVYYSVSGNTARVARDIAKLMRADVESLRDARHGVGFGGYLKAVIDAVRQKPAEIGPLGKNPRDYELVVIGTPVWAWHMTPAVRAYLERVKADLPKVAFFVTSGDTDIGKIAPEMEMLAGKKALAAAGFSAKALADRGIYDAKLTGFVAAMMDSAAASQPAEPGGAVAAVR